MIKNQEGLNIPKIEFKIRKNDEWQTISTNDLFKGKKVIVFGLPGAFTPTCSSTHLPRFNQLASTFKDSGIDDIICTSVNDTFVMNAWSKDQEAEGITMLPDGNGEFAEAVGMLVDKSAIGFGKRSWRYSMLVNDGKIEKMFPEPEKEGDPFEVSDADTMLQHINPKAKEPDFVTLFSKDGCAFCNKAKKLLEDKGIAYEEIKLGKAVTSRSMKSISGGATTPQVYFNGKHIGGADGLEEFLKA